MDELKSAAPVALSLATISALPSGVASPAYRREELSAGIVHFGVGNFHRAHMAVYLHRLMQMGLAKDWAIIGAGVTAHDTAIYTALKSQDFLSTVVARDATRVEAQVTGAMIGFVPPGDFEALHAQLCDPAIRIVSLTITEGGYFLDAEGNFDASHPAIRRDAENPHAPRTVFGVIARALEARRAKAVAPFTVMSCDNIPHNGAVTRHALVGLALARGVEFGRWVETNVATPNGMVDRITPATGEVERAEIRKTFGVADAWPVFCETFEQWVMEDRFPSGRPPFEKVGVSFVEDVSPYEAMKIRILNGGHAAIAYPAGLMGIVGVDEAMADPLVRGFLAKLERDEIIPMVTPPPGVDLEAYRAKVEERFSNPCVGDTIRRLCLDGSNRQPKFIIPVVADAIAAGRSFEGLALVSALWCRYCYGQDEAGATIAPNDPNWDRLVATSQAAKSDPAAWLAMRDIYGAVGEDAAFGRSFARWLARIWEQGVAKTLQAWLAA
jgi:mannitol 2-dehydrogenase